MKAMREEIFAYIKKKYKTTPEYPWGESDGAVLRHSDNRKWFALVMRVGRGKLGLAGDGSVDVVNLKIDDMVFKDVLMQNKGILPAYHMNKEHWITVLLDGTVEEDQVCNLIDLSFAATASKKKKTKMRPARSGSSRRTPSFMISSMPLTRRRLSSGSRAVPSKRGTQFTCMWLPRFLPSSINARQWRWTSHIIIRMRT